MIEPRVTTFFIDRCLGSVKLAASFRRFDITVEVDDDHFPLDAQDEEWLLKVGNRSWIVLTMDAKQDLSSEDMIAVFRVAFPAMQAFPRKHSSSFVAKVY